MLPSALCPSERDVPAQPAITTPSPQPRLPDTALMCTAENAGDLRVKISYDPFF